MKDLPLFKLLSFIEHVPVNLKNIEPDSLVYIAKNVFDTVLRNSKLYCKIFKFVPKNNSDSCKA